MRSFVLFAEFTLCDGIVTGNHDLTELSIFEAIGYNVGKTHPTTTTHRIL